MIYQLKIRSWAERSRGYQSGAEHYMGTIRVEGSKEYIDLTHVVEIRNPVYADDSLRYFSAKPGDMMETNRFETKEEIKVAAAKWMKENAKPEDILVEI